MCRKVHLNFWIFKYMRLTLKSPRDPVNLAKKKHFLIEIIKSDSCVQPSCRYQRWQWCQQATPSRCRLRLFLWRQPSMWPFGKKAKSCRSLSDLLFSLFLVHVFILAFAPFLSFPWLFIFVEIVIPFLVSVFFFLSACPSISFNPPLFSRFHVFSPTLLLFVPFSYTVSFFVSPPFWLNLMTQFKLCFLCICCILCFIV